MGAKEPVNMDVCEQLRSKLKEAVERSRAGGILFVINSTVADEEFQAARKEIDIKFINKEHFFYWRIYNQVVGEIPKASPSAPSPFTGEGWGEVKSCPCCGAAMGVYHCPTCGFSCPLEESCQLGS